MREHQLDSKERWTKTKRKAKTKQKRTVISSKNQVANNSASKPTKKQKKTEEEFPSLQKREGCNNNETLTSSLDWWIL